MSAASSKRLANLTISLFQPLRLEESFESFYNVVLKKMKELPFISEPKLPQKRCTPDYSIINHFSSGSGSGSGSGSSGSSSSSSSSISSSSSSSKQSNALTVCSCHVTYAFQSESTGQFD